MNKIILTGNLTKEITTARTLDDKLIVKTTIAVNRDYKTKGEYLTDFFEIVAYSQVATYLNDYAYKGGKLELCGRLETRELEKKDGTKKTIYEVIVESAKMLTKKQVEIKSEDDLPPLDLTPKTATKIVDDEDDDDDLPF